MSTVKIVKSSPHHFFYYLSGMSLLGINRIRHAIQGYKAPRTFPMDDIGQAIRYDYGVVQNWLKFLDEYSGHPLSLKGKTILELGPGADLGVGVILLWKGAAKYNALDVNHLIRSVPDRFYQELLDFLNLQNDSPEVSPEFLGGQLQATYNGRNDKLNYVCDRSFDVTIFKGEDIDYILSQASFEQFDDVEKTLKQLSEISKPGTVFLAEIDLGTLTRWIRDIDPLNIYRYPDCIYHGFKFLGSPNRLRPFEYEKFLNQNGWRDVKIFPETVLEEKYVRKVQNHLWKKFRKPVNQMDYLSVVICATKD